MTAQEAHDTTVSNQHYLAVVLQNVIRVKEHGFMKCYFQKTKYINLDNLFCCAVITELRQLGYSIEKDIEGRFLTGVLVRWDVSLTKKGNNE